MVTFLSKLFVLTLCLSYVYTAHTKKNLKKIISIGRFEVCELPPTSPVKLVYLKVEHNDDFGVVGNCRGNVTRDIKSDKLHMEMDVTRCASRESLDTCEHYALLKPPNFCMFLNMNGMGWQPFVTNFEPPLQCPFKKGIYTGRNITFDPSAFKLFRLDDWYWKVKFKTFEDKLLLLTVCAEAKVVNRN